LTLLEKVRDLSSVGAVTLVLLSILIWAVSLMGDGSASSAAETLDALSSTFRVVETFASGYAKFLLWFGALTVCFALFLSARAARRRVVEAWEADASKIRARLVDHPDELNALLTDSTFREWGEGLNKLTALLYAAEMTQSVEMVEVVRQEQVRLLNLVALEKSRQTLDVEQVLRGDSRPSSPSNCAKSRVQVLATLLVGPRLSKDLGLVGRYVTHLHVALLLVALTGWSAASLANSLQVSVNNLRIRTLTEDVERAVDQAVARIAPDSDTTEHQPDPVLTRPARVIAQAAVRRIHNAGLLEPLGPPAPERSSAEFVRAAILHRPFEAGERPTAVERLRQQVAEGLDGAGDGSLAPPEELVRRIEGEVEDLLAGVRQRNPQEVDRLVERVIARYGTSLNPLDVESNLISRMVSASFDLLGDEATDELSMVAKALVADVGKSAVSQWASLHAKAIVAEGLLGRSAEMEVMRRLDAGELFEKSSRSSMLLRDLQSARGTGWRPSVAERASERISGLIADAVAERFTPGQGQAIGRLLRGYSAVFPRAGFATDFARAARSSWARGVIFGRDVNPEFEVTDIEWELSSESRRRTTMTLSVRVDGANLDLGTFAAGVVNQALRFAADERVVAATIAPGDGRAISRVTYLHPVLEDTPLGCRIVEADRIIDSYTRRYPDSHPMTRFSAQLDDITSNRQAVWSFLEVARAAEYAAGNPQQCDVGSLRERFNLEPLASNLMALQPNRTGQFIEALDRNHGSTRVVEAALECSAGANQITDCLCQAVRDVDLSSPYWLPEDHTSQVRERDVSGRGSFDVLFRPQRPSDFIDLWIHTTFGVRVAGQVVGEEPQTSAAGFPAEQIDLLNHVVIPEGIGVFVEQGLVASGYADFMSPIEQFVVIQRFMRAALAGRFGAAFPLEKLVSLERVTAPYVPTQPTIRWEYNDAEEFRSVLAESGEHVSNVFFRWYLDLESRRDEGLPMCDVASH